MSGESATAQHFPEIEWNWRDAVFQPAWHEPIFTVMSGFVPEGATILEVGAGASHTLAALSGRRNCKAFGVEPNDAGIRKTIEMAQLEHATLELIKGDGFELPFKDESFDVVYSLGLIEHFEPAQSVDLVAEHARVCRPSGRVIVSVPNLWNLPHTLRKAVLGKKYEYAPERSYSPASLRRVFESCGLTVVGVDGVEPLWGMAMSGVGWKVCRVLDRLGIAKRMNNIKNSFLRSRIGYMTYAVGRKAGK